MPGTGVGRTAEAPPVADTARRCGEEIRSNANSSEQGDYISEGPEYIFNKENVGLIVSTVRKSGLFFCL